MTHATLAARRIAVPTDLEPAPVPGFGPAVAQSTGGPTPPIRARVAVSRAPEGSHVRPPRILLIEDNVHYAAALRNNLSVKAATVDERARKLASDLSFNRFFPSVSVQGTALRLNQTLPSVVGVMGGVSLTTPPTRCIHVPVVRASSMRKRLR